MLQTISYGDAVSNDVLALERIIIEMGHDTDIYAEGIDPRILKQHDILSAIPLPKLGSEDILIYHFSIGTELNHTVTALPCRKIMVYHNVTPPMFFTGYNSIIRELCARGRKQIFDLAEAFEYCLADSDYNREDLRHIGYTCPINVLPILIPFDDYAKKPNEKVLENYNDDRTNILFVGRVAPHKKIEDVIAAFTNYKKFYDSNARLFLVGSYEGTETYKKRLDDYIQALGVMDIYITGKITFDEILAYYKLANVFLCMSEHEGFCVPLVEAMFFDIPIVAYAATAVPDTLAGSGVLLKEKNPVLTAGVIDRLLHDQQLRDTVIAGQQCRLNDFAYEKVRELFQTYVMDFINWSQPK